MDELMEKYLNRILPVVGKQLRNKRIAFYNLQMTHRIAEAFARCGVRRFMFFDESHYEMSSPMHLSYGGEPDPFTRLSEVLIGLFKAHNHFETGWELETAGTMHLDVSDRMNRSEVDLLVGGGSIKECQMMGKIARDSRIPTVLFSIFPERDIESLVSVIDVNRGLEFSLFDELPGAISTGLDPRLRLLETGDLAGSLAKAMLLLDSGYERSDIRRLLYHEKRNNILYGKTEWPWWIFYGSARSKDMMRELVVASGPYRENPRLFTDERIMVIGCGTGSLFAEEASNYYRNFLLADCKEFSIYNPVRQFVSTQEVGSGLKPFVLQDKLLRRMGGPRERIFHELAETMRVGDMEISACELHLTEDDPSSVARFQQILDWYRPTLVIVGMGKARDDNYVAGRILHERNIPHIVPGLYPLATHMKLIVVPGKHSPCYGCFQGRLVVDHEGDVALTEEQREMFYGFSSAEEGTQPATIFETWPSVHAMLRLAVEMSKPAVERKKWFNECVTNNKLCFIGGSILVERDSEPLYGVIYPGQVVVYSDQDIERQFPDERCLDCGR